MKFQVNKILNVVLPAVAIACLFVVVARFYADQRLFLEDQRAVRDRAAIDLAEINDRAAARERLMKIKAEMRTKQRNFCENVKHGMPFDHPNTWQTICVDPKGVLGVYYVEKDFK